MSHLMRRPWPAGDVATEARCFQDEIPGNHCWGCGPANPHGLHVRSRWEGEEAVCTWWPDRHHTSGPCAFLNGGIIGAIIDCHCICTAIAAANLKAIGTALYTYASENSDHFPPNLSRLYELRLISNPKTFWSPGDSDSSPLTIS